MVLPAYLGAGAATAPSTRPALVSASGPAGKTRTLDECRKLYMKGDYAGAERGYGRLVEGKQGSAAAIGLAGALSARGKYADALEVLKKGADPAVAGADWHVAVAVSLRNLGRYAESLTHAAKANRLRPDWAPAILIRGGLLETLGRKDEAKAVYKTMSKVVSGDTYRSDPRSLVAVGQILHRYTILTAQKASGQADNIFNNYIRHAYVEVDEGYWPAQVAAGMFALSKHRTQTAIKEFQLALKHNRRCADAMVGLGAVELERWRFESCLRRADAALKINPNHADALLLKAVCMMQWRKFDQVEPLVKKVLKTNPDHLEALSLGAALHIRLRADEKAKPYIETVKKTNPNYAGLPNTIGQWLAAGRQYKQAETYYRRAMEVAPELAGPVTNLGCLYMQTGQEDEARATLAKAHEIDDFRADVVNYLRILKKLKGFLVKETDHFIVKVSGDEDAVLLDQIADYMEQIHPEICGDFDYEPARKTIVEIFPTHSQFSIRLAGKGWVGTIGACTGRVIVLVAPSRQRSRFGTFNWATVLRHEYTHTVTLTSTNNRIPHWFTEACAVWQQPDRRNYDAVKILVGATRGGRLFPVKELDWGFIRPKRTGARSLAYAQAEWIMEYIIETKGYQAVGKVLKAFRDGWSQEEVFAKVLGATEKQFDKDFAAWAKKQIVEWGYTAEPLPDLAKAAAAAKAKPDDAEAQARLAVARYVRRQLKAAEAAAGKALKLDPKNKHALAVLAQCQLAAKKHDQAIKTAEKLENLRHDSRTAPRVLAECYLAKRQWANAIAALELLKQRMPLDPWPYEQLANKYVQLGRPGKALPNLIELHRRTLKDPKYARQIAEIYQAMEKNDEALSYFQQIIRVNPYEASAYEAIAAIHRSKRRYDKAIAAIDKVCMLQRDSADAWTKMAMMRYLAGRADRDAAELGRAKKAAEKALSIDSGSRARQVIEMIDAILETLEEDGDV